jgi:hypothetical protein
VRGGDDGQHAKNVQRERGVGRSRREGPAPLSALDAAANQWAFPLAQDESDSDLESEDSDEHPEDSRPKPKPAPAPAKPSATPWVTPGRGHCHGHAGPAATPHVWAFARTHASASMQAAQACRWGPRGAALPSPCAGLCHAGRVARWRATRPAPAPPPAPPGPLHGHPRAHSPTSRRGAPCRPLGPRPGQLFLWPAQGRVQWQGRAQGRGRVAMMVAAATRRWTPRPRRSGGRPTSRRCSRAGKHGGRGVHSTAQQSTAQHGVEYHSTAQHEHSTGRRA